MIWGTFLIFVTYVFDIFLSPLLTAEPVLPFGRQNPACLCHAKRSFVFLYFAQSHGPVFRVHSIEFASASSSPKQQTSQNMLHKEVTKIKKVPQLSQAVCQSLVFLSPLFTTMPGALSWPFQSGPYHSSVTFQ
jgi:hypothetical protein